VAVAKPKPKIPLITLAAPRPFALDERKWIQIERAFGRCLDGQTRQEILVVTMQFLRFAEAESNTGLMSDAVGRVRLLRKHARSLLRIVDDTSGLQITQKYVDEQIAAAGGRRNFKVFSAELAWFAEACDMALSQMNNLSRHRFWPDGGSWQNWIRQLTEIAKRHELPFGARKDTDKVKQGKVSPFVKFVNKLQTYIPDAHRRGAHSIEALSVAINTARSRPKPPF
jgi:hypothetical protein